MPFVFLGIAGLAGLFLGVNKLRHRRDALRINGPFFHIQALENVKMRERQRDRGNMYSRKG